MSGPSDRRFDLNLGEEAVPPSPDNIWRPSFISPTGPLIVGDSVMKNDMTAAVVARNLVTPKDNRLLSKRSDELAVKDSLALSVQCVGSMSNMAQRLGVGKRVQEPRTAHVIRKMHLAKAKSAKQHCSRNLKKKKRVGPVDPPRIGPFETGRVRSGSKTQNLSTRSGPPRYCLKRVRSGSFKIGPDSARAQPYQRLFARTRQVESLAAEVMSLKQEIRGLKHENKQLHRLAHNYATNMKRKIDQIQEFDGQILLDHKRFMGLFQQHLPSSSGAVLRNEAPNDQPPAPLLPRVPPSDKASHKQP
ncbi:unnamed protein product [Malus baccata var. baccata]